MSKILQIIPVSKPLVAVFKDDESEIGIDIYDVHAIELIEDSDGNRSERAVIAFIDDFDNVDDLDKTLRDTKDGYFLGYAKDKKEAVRAFSKKDLEARKINARCEYKYFASQGHLSDEQLVSLKAKLCKRHDIDDFEVSA